MKATYAVLTPYLVVRDAAKAIDFYRKVLGAQELFRLTEPSGKIGHAELTLGAARFMIADEYPDFGALSPVAVGGTPVSLHLYVDDVDAIVERAAQSGATVLRPPKDEFFGDRSATLSDPFGHRWQIATKKEEIAPAEMQKRWSAMFS